MGIKMSDRTQNILDKISLIQEREKEIIHEAQKLIHDPRTTESLICLNSVYDNYKKLMTQKEFCQYCLMYDTVESDL